MILAAVTRNGIPPPVPYAWRTRRYPVAEAAIAAAEAMHGPPAPVCWCGGRMRFRSPCMHGRCDQCGASGAIRGIEVV